MIVSSTNFEKKTLVEIGCGTGLLSILAYQVGAKVIATDYLDEIIDLARVESWCRCDVGKCRTQWDSGRPNQISEARFTGRRSN